MANDKMTKKNNINYKQIIHSLKDLEQFEYPVSPEVTNQFKELTDYDKNSGLIGWCHFLGTFLWQLRINFDALYRPFIQEYHEIKTDRDKATLMLLHLILKHAKQLFSDYDDAILRILKREEI